MNLEDLESYRSAKAAGAGRGGDVDDECSHSFSTSRVQERVTKPHLFLYGFCTGFVSQIIVFGCVDLFFGNSILINSKGEVTHIDTSSASNGNKVYVPYSKMKKWTFACVLLAICFTSCMGVFYILSFMPIFRQPSRRIRIRIRHLNDNDNNNCSNDNNMDDYDDGCDFDYELGSRQRSDGMAKNVRRSIRSFVRRLNAIDTFFSLGHLVSSSLHIFVCLFITDIYHLISYQIKNILSFLLIHVFVCTFI